MMEIHWKNITDVWLNKLKKNHELNLIKIEKDILNIMNFSIINQKIKPKKKACD
jgi:hypothetical protein